MEINSIKNNCALIIVDMQNAFFSDKGSYKKREKKLLKHKTVINNSNKIISIFKKNKLPIIFTLLSFNPNYSDAGLLIKKFPGIKELNAYKNDSFDSKLYLKLIIDKNDFIIKKSRYNPFIRTNLKSILNKNNIKTVFLIGALTNVCVETTASACFDNGYFPFIISDATTSYDKTLHKNSLININAHYGSTLKTSECIKLINEFNKPNN